MVMTDVRHHRMHDGRRIAYRHAPGTDPTIVFLPGYKSDMAGGKASAVWDWARARGRGCLFFDYSGCGLSDGDFALGTLSRWRDEAQALIEVVGARSVILVGSSMGGWLMLLVAEALGDRIIGLVGVAAAPDFTRWGRSDADRAKLAAGDTVYDPNPYGSEPTPIHPAFSADAELWHRLDRPIPIVAPMRLLHGQLDDDVPFAISLRLAATLRSDAVHVVLIKDGDHRLSRPQDIALLLRTIGDLTGD